jgi:thioester reductase-like protein
MALKSIFYDAILVLAHADALVTADYICQLLKYNVVTGLLAAPSTLEELSENPDTVESLATLEHVAYAGGPLHQDVGTFLASKLGHLCSLFGATENGLLHMITSKNDKWDCIRVFSGIGYRFDEVSEGSFELVIVKDDNTNKYHGIFEHFPDIREYRTKDLFEAVLGSPGWFRYRGRSDDLIVLSNGEKVDPIPMEIMIRSHALVKAALIVGEFRFAPSLLVELKEGYQPNTEAERQEMLQIIWPTVEEANRIAPTFSQISKSLVIFATSDSPFKRAGKGTVQRGRTVQDYSKALDKLYADAQEGILVEGLTLEDPANAESVKVTMREIYRRELQPQTISDDDNIFNRGMDSLRVTVIVQRIKAALRSCKAPINISEVTPRLVYANPSINQAAAVISALISDQDQKSGETAVVDSAMTQESKITDMVRKYSTDLPSPILEAPSGTSRGKDLPWTVVMTGTTGSLGSYILDTLLALPTSRVAKIYCLNRSEDSEKRQKKINLTRGLNREWDGNRVEFLCADLSQDDLGLGRAKYAKLLKESTVTIHSAWKVDFNLTLESFEGHVCGVRHLLDFSGRSANRAPLLFLSSISTVLGWLSNHPRQAVPECVLHDTAVPEATGYGESKYASEHLLDNFSSASGITTAVLRTGQIAGPTSETGNWQKREWLPSLVASSKHLRVLPATIGSMDTVDWIPVDVLASIIIELLGPILAANDNSDKRRKALVYNLVNPKVTLWSTLLPTVQQHLGGSSVVKIVPLKVWVNALEKSASANHGFITEQNPGVKLLDFFRRLLHDEAPETAALRYVVARLVKDSPKAAELEQVSPTLMKLWMEQWAF